jgi:hypothetical protein
VKPATILGGEVRIQPAVEGRCTAIEAYESVFGFRNRLYVTKHGYSVTANLAVRRTDFAAIGPFPGIEFAEDMQWGQMAIRAGREFRYVPEMVVFHPARCSLRELYAKWDRSPSDSQDAGAAPRRRRRHLESLAHRAVSPVRFAAGQSRRFFESGIVAEFPQAGTPTE